MGCGHEYIEGKRKRAKKFLKGADWFIDYYTNSGRIREKIGPNKRLAESTLQKRKIQVIENRHLDIRNNNKIRLFDFIELYINDYSKVNKRSYKDDIYRSRRIKEFLKTFILQK